MVSGDNTTVILTGGGPWGFRLTGGGSLPLQIAKIRKKSQAHAKGLQEGDAVVSINGTPVHDRTHDQAVDLIDAAGETLTLQIYRGDSDDLGRLLAHKKVQSLIRPGQGDGSDLAALTTSSNVITSSNSTVQDDGNTRREVQEKVFVIAEGDIQSSSFVRREHTVTTSATTSSAGDVNGNVGVLGGGGGGGGGGGFTATVALSADVSMPQQSLSPGPALSLSPQPGFQSPRQQSSSPHRPLSPAQPAKFIPSVAPTTFSPRPGSSPQPTFSSSSPQPAFQPMQQQQQPMQQSTPAPYRAPRPTFKAVAPKTGPPVPPKPLFHPQYNAKAPVQAPQPPAFSPNKFQVSATAMYAPPQQAYSPGGGSQPYSPVSQPYSPVSQPYSPGVGGGTAPFSPGGAYSPVGQSQQVSFVRQTSVKQLFSPGNQQQQQQQLQSPMSPMSPQQQPFSPLSPSNNMTGPMFHVRNNYGDTSKKNTTWQANMWLPGEDPSRAGGQQRQQQQQQRGGGGGGGNNNENIEIPKKMSVKEKQQALLAHAARTKHSLLARSADPTFDAPPEEVQRARATGGGHPHQHPLHGGGGHHHGHHKLHVFGPPVEMTPEGPLDGDLGLVRTYSGQSDDSGSSSAIRRQKKMYSDSAFYADPVKNYPTIEDQMKLCRIISTSLTSAANKRARGARMFAKRQKRAPKWVHESQYEWSSSAGDVGNLDDLDSELLAEEGGQKQLLTFRIPNLRQRVGSPEKNTKMSMKKDEFERLRLQSQKCDHKTISPGACFDIVADLRASKGKAGRMFEKRKNRADKYVTDESNAKVAPPKQTRLDDLLNTPLKSRQSPWQAAQSDQGMDAAFEHISERERMQRLNRILKYNPTQGPPKPQLTPSGGNVGALPPMEPLPLVGPRTNLKGGQLNVLQGKNFNRAARGWGGAGGGNDYRQERASSAGPATHHMQPPQAPMMPASQDYADYAQDYPQQSSAPRSQQPKVHFGDYNPRPRAWQPPSQQQQQGGDYHSCPPSMSASWNSSDFAQDYHNGYDDVGACDL